MSRVRWSVRVDAERGATSADAMAADTSRTKSIANAEETLLEPNPHDLSRRLCNEHQELLVLVELARNIEGGRRWASHRAPRRLCLSETLKMILTSSLD